MSAIIDINLKVFVIFVVSVVADERHYELC